MAKLSYLSASETRALLCKYFDKVCSKRILLVTVQNLLSPHAMLLALLGCTLAEGMLTGIIPAGGVSARGGTQAPACLG